MLVKCDKYDARIDLDHDQDLAHVQCPFHGRHSIQHDIRQGTVSITVGQFLVDEWQGGGGYNKVNN